MTRALYQELHSICPINFKVWLDQVVLYKLEVVHLELGIRRASKLNEQISKTPMLFTIMTPAPFPLFILMANGVGKRPRLAHSWVILVCRATK